MSPTLSTFLYEAANFLLLAALLGWLFFRPVRTALAENQARLQSAADETARKLADAEALRAELEHQRTAFQAELENQRTQTIESARKQAEDVLSEARLTAQREQERALDRAAKRAEAESERLSRMIAAVTAASVERLLKQINGPDLDAALIRAAERQLRSLPDQELAPVKVESAHPLSAGLMGELRAALRESAESAVFAVDGGLISGVRITTAQGLIEATALGLSGFAHQALLRSLQFGRSHNNERG